MVVYMENAKALLDFVASYDYADAVVVAISIVWLNKYGLLL